MAKSSKIAWCDGTYNTHKGCRPVSEGCVNCYVKPYAARTGWDFNKVVRTSEQTFNAPLKWSPRVVFVCSLSDFFIEEADAWREEAYDVMRRASQHFYLFLTKRPENIASRLPNDWPWPNAGLGITAENKQRLNERAPILLSVPASLHFLSWEPGLGPLAVPTHEGTHVCEITGKNKRWDLLFGHGFDNNKPTQESIWENRGFDWVIGGGESGPNARPVNPLWVYELFQACALANVPFCFKQWGEWRDGGGDYRRKDIEKVIYYDGTTVDFTQEAMLAEEKRSGLSHNTRRGRLISRVGKIRAGREIDDIVYDERPAIITKYLEAQRGTYRGLNPSL